jgi:NhaA family Na+:H+ antiporter
MAGSFRGTGKLLARREQATAVRTVLMPVQQFLRIELLGSLLLMATAIVAIVWANSPWAESYFAIWRRYLTVDLLVLELNLNLQHWINDALMAFFFFVVGLEIKRELVHGNLADRRKATLPAIAAIGGMVVPALAYVAFNSGGPGAGGWGIPVATDIAFAVGVLGLLGNRVSIELRVFLLALAIVDDIGAILVIALFYTESLSPGALVWAAAFLGLIVVLQRLGVRSTMAYVLVGALVWLAVFESGLHATIAGVVLGLMTPSSPYVDPAAYPDQIEGLREDYMDALAEGNVSQQQAALGRIEEVTQWTESPVEKMERLFHPWTAYLVLPLFALANAGVALSGEALRGAVSSPVTLGVILGLVLGKLVGVSGAAWIAVKLGLADLPSGVRWGQVAGTGLLAGIGFTMSIFVTTLAFYGEPGLIDEAKIGILVASVLAGVLGYLLLRMSSGTRAAG